jgi:AAA15 family ATPase/GTPase
MLRKFRVSNFKGFEDTFELDLSNPNNYEFNQSCVVNNTVNNAIVYGKNGVGKSNLALAIFDIIEHLTDYNKIEFDYENYLNALSKQDIATFHFEFIFDNTNVTYKYSKSDYKTLVFEQLLIDDNVVIDFDRSTDKNAIVLLEGTEHLNTHIESKELSILKYVKNNTVLKPNRTNKAFLNFFDFVEKMLFFRSLNDRKYLGFRSGKKNILEDIIENGNLLDFERFLNKAGIECNLLPVYEGSKETIYFNFDNVILPFEKVASTGTHTLTLFYFWLQSIKQSGQVSFVFIDEFDAFYHSELTLMVVEKLKESNVQFILTTHNTSIMTNELLRPDCYFIMYKDLIKSLPQLTSKELREAHNLEKMYKAGSFDER